MIKAKGMAKLVLENLSQAGRRAGVLEVAIRQGRQQVRSRIFGRHDCATQEVGAAPGPIR